MAEQVHSSFTEGTAPADSEMTSTSFLTPATNPAITHTGRHSIDFNDKVPQVMEWTSTLAKEPVQIPPISTSDLDQTQGTDQEPRTPTASSIPAGGLEADLEELHKLTPTLIEVSSAPDIPALGDLSLNLSSSSSSSSPSTNPSYLSSKPYSVSSHYAKGLDVPSSAVPSPPSSIIAEPPSPTLSHASLKMGSTSSTAGDDLEQDREAMEQDDPAPISQHFQQQQSSSIDTTMSQSAATATPVASTDDIPSGAFVVPRREILTKEDLELFHGSPTYAALFAFLDELNESVVGVVSTADCYQSEVVKGMLEILDLVNQVTEEYPPETGHESRFGNPAFRKFYDQIGLSAPGWMEKLSLPKEAVPEVTKYFVECWGNRKRIDYGTGHEASFLAWLYCFAKLGLIKKEDYKAVVINVFFKYIEVMRNLQFAYWLEPAGSHGVWGLDDYHFLPFLFGAAQLRGHKYIRPKSIHDNDIVSEFSKDYMYLSCVKFINSVKSASLRWHSPMLDDISAVKTWDKVNSGMIKMYKAEVFGKLPIMQHFLFGSLLPFKGQSDNRILDEDEEEAGVEGHQHIHAFGQEFPTCCGMKIPSAIAAAAASGGASSGARRLPFD
ncbi:Serine/threonine-protein phosphatase 2A activator 2 [Linnemannia schmuckeri]|uniref:Serine/threonine-protein phosphatase 2A activator n=1 Tax=Linnemannia schmuckeri TaxID=64567 RepID=A0A9P5S776_9FUNG|nr:Serine/threonine-protein phosphatase 2A activator 2 [Linnemannia schmuckeri]